jgi:glutathione S-transferase
MWTRRIDLNIIEPMANGYRFSQGLALFESRLHCIPQAAEDLKVTAQKGLAWLDGLITGRTFIRGESLSLADIMLFAFLDFGAKVGQPIDPALKAITAHHAMMAARPSAAA